MKLIRKLLRENINKAQLIGFALANLLGLLIILVSLQCYLDISPIFNPSRSFFAKDYFTLTKKVNVFNSLSTNAAGFSAKELSELQAQQFVNRVGAFTSSHFQVYAGINQGGVQFGSEMFFESVPDSFIDVDTQEWTFDFEKDIIPIILPKNYLDLYNFGFADARSLPKISEGMAGMVQLDVTLYGNGGRGEFKGRIVGFSDRLNTILVPESFMLWANEYFGNTSDASPARVLVEVDNIGDPDIVAYFNAKGYEVEGDRAATSRIASLLKIILGIVITIGVVICLLSMFVFVLSIYLLLEKNMDKFAKLRLLGFSKNTVCRPYTQLIIFLNLFVCMIAIVGVFAAQLFYTPLLSRLWNSFSASHIFYTCLVGLFICIFASVMNIYILRQKIK